MSMANQSPSPLAIRLTDIHKSFGPVRANRGASIEVVRGEIHALVGENGAGKSTLMRVLSGMYAPDSGRMEVNGREVTGWSTADAIAAGVGMVHQHFMLVPTLTVAENMMLGRELTRSGQVDVARAARETAELSRTTGLAVRPERKVSDLSVGEAQRVEILKTLYRGATVLILDEPTAVLSPPEIRELWHVLRGMRERGETIVLITHKLGEVMEISDTITVMRQGRTVDRLRTVDTTPGEIARAMVGRDVQLAAQFTAEELERTSPPRTLADAAPLLEVRDLVVDDARGLTAVNGVTFSVHPGEILGIAGVEGNGQTELLEALAGLRRARSGTIHVARTDVTSRPVKERGDLGLSHIPEDRHARGLVLDYSVAENLVLGQQHRFTRGVRLDQQEILANARRQIERFDIRPDDPGLAARALSGGNQQKVVIAREMGRDFQVLLAAQPTRGVDVGAIEFIHARLRDARQAGKAILLVSADLGEILALSNRVAVMYGGRLVTIVPRADATEEVLGPYMTGAAGQPGANAA
ncbi:MAG TPA: ABC transporter ATP-binding protein [Gemmatimonadaceae bacterium]|jgi:general nucleoside transport system ATP-binding protein|nr:ABC transporter ATP-binding protein [Gemmatimonadaceae bacterium]